MPHTDYKSLVCYTQLILLKTQWILVIIYYFYSYHILDYTVYFEAIYHEQEIQINVLYQMTFSIIKSQFINNVIFGLENT